MKFIIGIAVGCLITAVSLAAGAAVGVALMNGTEPTTEEK